MLAPICCEMLIDTASRPLPVTSSVRSGDAGKDRAEIGDADRRAVLHRAPAPRAISSGAGPEPRGEREVLLARFGEPARPAAAGSAPSTPPTRRSPSDPPTVELQRIEHDFDLARVAGEHLDVPGARHARERRAAST